MQYVWYLLAGMFMWNSLPHLVKGITGQTHMTPLKRVSSPMVNVVYAFINIVLALFFLGLANGTGGFAWPWEVSMVGVSTWVFLAGALFMSLADAWLFSKPNACLPWQKG